jgi:hypothetical protein
MAAKFLSLKQIQNLVYILLNVIYETLFINWQCLSSAIVAAGSPHARKLTMVSDNLRF